MLVLSVITERVICQYSRTVLVRDFGVGKGTTWDYINAPHLLSVTVVGRFTATGKWDVLYDKKLHNTWVDFLQKSVNKRDKLYSNVKPILTLNLFFYQLNFRKEFIYSLILKTCEAKRGFFPMTKRKFEYKNKFQILNVKVLDMQYWKKHITRFNQNY